MADAFEELLGGDVLSEDVKTSLTEAWEVKLSEAREQITNEIREEFAGRYTNDKEQIVEAMDNMLTDAIKQEVEEFAHDKGALIEARVQYKQRMREHAEVLDKFLMNALKKEITELREDRNTQGTNFKKLEGFVLKQLTKELNEFHTDKQSVVEQKVKLVKEGKQLLRDTKANFVRKAAEKVEHIVESTLRGEIGALKEDIKSARENAFGRKMFEAFAAEFMTSHLAEGTEVKKLSTKIKNLEGTIEEAQVQISSKQLELSEAQKLTRIAEDIAKRDKVLSELLTPLSRDKKEIMEDLLSTVQTENLKKQYEKYLPTVLNENVKKESKQESKKTLKENVQPKARTQKTVITGNKPIHVSPVTTDAQAEIINLQKLAGL
jgi:copper chaperone CopZ